MLVTFAGFCLYVVMITSVLAVPLIAILEDQNYNYIYAISTASLVFASTVCVALLFATKVRPIEQSRIR